jgi:hypothetical protein
MWWVKIKFGIDLINDRNLCACNPYDIPSNYNTCPAAISRFRRFWPVLLHF